MCLNILSQLLAILFLFKLLPVPVNLDVLLVRLDDLILDLVCSLLFSLLFTSATVFVQLLGVSFDLDDLLGSLSSELLESAFGFFDSLITVRVNGYSLLHKLLFLGRHTEFVTTHAKFKLLVM